MILAPPAARVWRTARGGVCLDRPVIAGILNATPDSFWDGGRHDALDRALERAGTLLDEGADILDVGGESTRPGATRVPPDVELQRVIPVIDGILRRWPDTILSVDTVRASTARHALDSGVAIVNDVSALRLDGALGGVVAAAGAGLILMHSRGSIENMARYDLAEYGDPVADVIAELGERVVAARTAGIADDLLVLDPGLGFAKRTEHSLAVLARLAEVVALDLPVMVGPSRKRFIGEAAGGLAAEARLEGTVAACVMAFERGARIFRVHDVAAVRRALDFAAAARQPGGA